MESPASSVHDGVLPDGDVILVMEFVVGAKTKSEDWFQFFKKFFDFLFSVVVHWSDTD